MRSPDVKDMSRELRESSIEDYRRFLEKNAYIQRWIMKVI
jgi:hypothetical protein